MPPCWMNAPSPSPRAARYNSASTKLGNKIVFQYFRNMVMLRCHTLKDPRADGILTVPTTRSTSSPLVAERHPRARPDGRRCSRSSPPSLALSRAARPRLRCRRGSTRRRSALRRRRPSRERSEEHTSELQSHSDLVCRLLLEKKKKKIKNKKTRTTKTNNI